MKLNKNAIDLLMAKKKWNTKELFSNADISSRTFYKGIQEGIYPKQVGKLAEALGAKVEDIIIQESE